jgi:ubiquitin-protein ligase
MTLRLKVEEGLHAGASYTFGLEFRDDDFLTSSYPPQIRCLSPIFHPNIVEDELICCNILGDEWESNTTLEGVITALYCLLDNPELDNALSNWWQSQRETSESDDETSSYDDLARYKNDLQDFIKQIFD